MPRVELQSRVEPVYALTSLPPSPMDGQVVRARAATGLPAFRVAYNATSGLWEPEGIGKLWEATGTGLTTGVSSIPQIFSHLRLEWMARTAAASGSNSGVRMRFNGVTTNYAWSIDGQFWNGSATSAYTGATGWTQNAWLVGLCASPGSNAAYVGKGTVEIPFYTRTDCVKSVHALCDWTDGANVGHTASGGDNNVTFAALTSLLLVEDTGSGFASNSRATLYGIP